MTDLRKAAEMAYEVMTDIHQVCDGANHKRKDMHPYGGDCPIQKRFDDAWEALRQALAQPEQEPVVGMFEEKLPDQNPPPWSRSYRLKREWVGLTDEEVDALLWKLSVGAVDEDVRTVEAKLKEKNT